MRHALARLVPAFLALLTGCVSRPATMAQENHPLSWMSGCWENVEGDYREVWSQPDHGFLFGYAFSLESERVAFFEQTRIEPGKPFVFNAYPAGTGPSPFPEVARSATSIEFANPDHDFPQRIRYARDADRLIATISLADGSDGQGFAFRPCKAGH